MAFIKTYDKNNRNILRINFERKLINLSPDYQRNGDIWNLEKRQLLIDSILNDYDIPKIYFHLLDKSDKSNKGFEYAVIDGRQRLETIWMFIDSKFPLSDDFKYFKDDSIEAKNMTYSELATKYPELKGLFDSFDLPIVCVETNDLDLIDDMFLRLNEAVPLNSAEKRNAIRGQMVTSINNTCKNIFFKNKVRFTNSRYQHKEAACKLLFIEYYLQLNNKIFDTKKPFLDHFVKQFKINKALKSKPYEINVSVILDEMNRVFIDNDPLLKGQSVVPIYYLTFRELKSKKFKVTRHKLIQFRDAVAENKVIAEKDITKAKYDLLEFDRLGMQGTNDAASIRERVSILANWLSSNL